MSKEGEYFYETTRIFKNYGIFFTRHGGSLPGLRFFNRRARCERRDD